MTGKDFVYVGLALCVISLGILGFAVISEDAPTPGRATFLSIMGVPVGVVITAIGVVMMIKQRRSR